MALLLGVADPLGLLSADRHDWDATFAVVEAADQVRLEQQRAVAVMTAHELAKVLGPLMQSTVNALARSIAQGLG